MTFKTFALPLSRWHHIADRIASLASKKQEEAVKALGHTQLSSPISDDQKEALKARGQKALQWAEEAKDALQVVGVIRVALAKANAHHGITTKLAEAESLRRQLKTTEELATIDLVTRTPVDEVNNALTVQASNRDAFGRNSGVTVSLVKASALDHLADQTIELKAKIAVLTDEVASLNRAPLELTLPEALAKAVGVVSE